MILQRNIVKKYQNLLGEEQTQKPWAQYQSYFLNEDIQSNIHKIKEEQFQEGFLRELFVKVLGQGNAELETLSETMLTLHQQLRGTNLSELSS